MTRQFLLGCLVLFAGPAAAAEYQFACTFEAPSGLTSDPIAKGWFTAVSFRSREFIVEMDPPKVVSGPGPDIFWGTPSINVDPKEIKFEWEVNANPVERRPRISLIVNNGQMGAETVAALTRLLRGRPPNTCWRSAISSGRGPACTSPQSGHSSRDAPWHDADWSMAAIGTSAKGAMAVPSQ